MRGRKIVFLVCAIGATLLCATIPAMAAPKPARGFVDGPTRTITAELTGYSAKDNTPPGSADICCGVIHTKAGGTGTYIDPITAAVPGHAGRGMQTPAGTRFYVPKLSRYFVVEDSGATPKKLTRFDLWVDGRGFPDRAAEACMDSFTGRATVVLNPRPGLPVRVGPLTGRTGCLVLKIAL